MASPRAGSADGDDGREPLGGSDRRHRVLRGGPDAEGERIGSLTGQIVVADVTADNVEEEVRQRTLTFALRSGQIVALGTSRYRLDPVAGVPVLRGVTTTAIVGGTGRFIGACGQVRTIRHADGTYTQVITLLK